MNNVFNANRIQYIAVACSIVLLIIIFGLTRKKKIKEEYSLLWLVFCFIFLIFSIWRKGLDFFAGVVGINYPPSALFLIFVLALFLILIQFSIIISRLTEQNKNLTQEIGILKLEITEIKKKFKNFQ